MDAIVREIGHKNNCTFCGVFRRQALDRGAQLLNVDTICTGHNADDIAETVLLNLLRGDVPRLQRCTNIITGGDGPIPRCKPFKYSCVAPPMLAARYCCQRCDLSQQLRERDRYVRLLQEARLLQH
jgi:tRNA(Ile)-lysidine synthase TilS/MesJ